MTHTQGRRIVAGVLGGLVFSGPLACAEPPPPPPVSEVFDELLDEGPAADPGPALVAERAEPSAAGGAPSVGLGDAGAELGAAEAAAAVEQAPAVEETEPSAAEAAPSPAAEKPKATKKAAATAENKEPGGGAAAEEKPKSEAGRPAEAPTSGVDPGSGGGEKVEKTEKKEPVAPMPAPEPPQARFAGTFGFAGGSAQRAEVEAAIEAAAQQMSAVIRGIARKRLTESNPIREKITIAAAGEEMTVTFAPGRTVKGRLGGPAVAWTSDSGKPVSVSFSMVKGRFVMNFTAEDGSRRAVFSLDESGTKLTMSVTISSERLETPMKYALSYKRG